MIVEYEKYIEYKRNIEAMGEGLAFFKISSKIRHVGMNFHLYYENGRKPPLDIAINPETNFIEYISCFVQDEKITKSKYQNNIKFTDKSIKFIELGLDDMNYEKSIRKDFNVVIEGNPIEIIEKGKSGNLTAYTLNNQNYILIDSDNDFAGIIMQDLKNEDIDKLIRTKCLAVY